MKPTSGRLHLAIVAAVGLALGAVEASQVRPVNLEEMSERAATIFSGRCVRVQSFDDPVSGRRVIRATFEIDSAIKGHAGPTVTFKMLAADRGGAGVVGLPAFREGEEVVLFLYGASPLGLTSPVGFGQGKFSVVEDKHGRKIAVNERGNRGLLRGLSEAARTRLGGDWESWRDRPEIDAGALLEMADRLRP